MVQGILRELRPSSKEVDMGQNNQGNSAKLAVGFIRVAEDAAAIIKSHGNLLKVSQGLQQRRSQLWSGIVGMEESESPGGAGLTDRVVVVAVLPFLPVVLVVEVPVCPLTLDEELCAKLQRRVQLIHGDL